MDRFKRPRRPTLRRVDEQETHLSPRILAVLVVVVIIAAVAVRCGWRMFGGGANV